MPPPLIDRSKFSEIFLNLPEKTGVVDGVGNIGDTLLQVATRQLLRHFQVPWETINPFADSPQDHPLQAMLVFAGGSMGGFQPCQTIRRACEKWIDAGARATILPQSFIEPEPFASRCRVFVRERESLSIAPPGAMLAPDLALGMEWPEPGPCIIEGKSVFLRHHGFSVFAPEFRRFGTDPAMEVSTWQEYYRMASAFEHVVTDRLHFAICAIAAGRKATLLPLRYHKNTAMLHDWLAELGCQQGYPDSITRRQLVDTKLQWIRLTAGQSS